ncbi:dephospho-CoA kinase [Shimia sp. W99]
MTFRLGLTGSIGMGKSTTAKMFAAEGCAVWDADAAVHRMYAEGGAAVEPIREKFPEAVVNGMVSREKLKELIGKDQSVLRAIEQIVHPLVAKDRADFAKSATADIIVFDIPLLFEGNGQDQMDAVACVTVSPKLQRKRVLERGTMSEEQFEQILENQMPNEEKCLRSDFVIETDTMEHARSGVIRVVETIRGWVGDA